MFEWDEAKRRLNLDKHGFDFWIAARVFDGRARVELPARFENETRTLSVVEIDDVFVTVVWTWRGENRRIISVRRSRREERQIYIDLQA